MNHLQVNGQAPRESVADDHGLALELELQPSTLVQVRGKESRRHRNEGQRKWQRHRRKPPPPEDPRFAEPDVGQRKHQQHADDVARPPGGPLKHSMIGRGRAEQYQRGGAPGRAHQAGEGSAQPQHANNGAGFQESRIPAEDWRHQAAAEKRLKRGADTDAGRHQQRGDERAFAATVERCRNVGQ